MLPAVLYQTASYQLLLTTSAFNYFRSATLNLSNMQKNLHRLGGLPQPTIFVLTQIHDGLPQPQTEPAVKPQGGVEDVLNTGVAYSIRISICSFWPV